MQIKHDLTSYMTLVKTKAAREGVKCYGPVTSIIKDAFKAGHSVDQTVSALIVRQDKLDACYNAYSRAAE